MRIILPDGSFLVAVLRNGGHVLHLTPSGTLIRDYAIPDTHYVALDIDGTSFWTNAGNVLLRIDIASGAVLSETVTGEERGVAGRDA